jgi:hypothetical protein
MSLLSAISISFSGYILPVLFYWYLARPYSMVERFLMVLVFLLGVASCIIGTVISTMSLIDDVKAGGNPFAGLFTFG